MRTFVGILWLSSIMISTSLDYPDKSTSSESSSQNLSFTPDNLEVVRKESFNEWEKWPETYPACNPLDNPNQSPIEIETENIEEGIDMKGVFIHSKVPVDDCLTLSLLYKEGDFEMEAVTLNPLPGCSQQLTYINGGGNKPLSLRYFKRAVFFFTNTELEEERSVHQLKGKQFHMEIMLEFVAANNKDYTQARSPEATPANPIFTALESSLKALKQEVLDEASGKTERAMKFKELQEACNINEEKHMKIHDEMKNTSDRLRTIKAIITNLNGITNDDIEKIKSSNLSPTENSNVSNSTNEKLEKLQSERSNLLSLMLNETEDWALDKLQVLLEKLEHVINKMEYCNNTGQNWNECKLENIKKRLKANKVGMPGESSSSDMLYDSPDAVYEDFQEIQGKMKEYEENNDLYNKSCHAFANFQMEPYAFVKVDQPFQISWLFPHTGGYYSYNGSSPIPECEQRDITIVFEESISITTEQLSLFQTLPSLELLQNGVSSNSNQQGGANQISPQNNGNLTVDQMVPVLYSSDKENVRKVWYVNKNPVFLDDDGFHKKSLQIKQSSGTALAIREYVHIFCTLTIGLNAIIISAIIKL